MNNPWGAPEVAQAQLDLVEGQLADDMEGHPPAPFREFLGALRHVDLPWRGGAEPRARMLDVGCGVGHYSVLVARHAPHLEYFGTDASPAMIQIARKYYRGSDPRAFTVCPFEDNAFEEYDLLLLSQVVEHLPDPPSALELALIRARRYVLLHRLRTQGAPGRVDEPTYCGYAAHNWVWSPQALIEMVQAHGWILYSKRWNGSLTLLLSKP